MRTRSSFLFLAAIAVIAGVAAAVWKAPGPLQLLPGCSANVEGHQVSLAPDQSENAALIAAIGVRRALPARAVSIALATAYQESKIRNLDYGDRDSLGLFQQRPSQGWGTPEQIRDPYFAINAFYDALVKVDGYESMPITQAAQLVQRSAFPNAYADHAADGRALASALTGHSPGGRFSCVVGDPDRPGHAATVVDALTRAWGDLDVRPGGDGLTVTVADRRHGWAVAQFLVAHAATLRVHSVAFDGKVWDARKSRSGWQEDSAGRGAVRVAFS